MSGSSPRSTWRRSTQKGLTWSNPIWPWINTYRPIQFVGVLWCPKNRATPQTHHPYFWWVFSMTTIQLGHPPGKAHGSAPGRPRPPVSGSAWPAWSRSPRPPGTCLVGRSFWSFCPDFLGGPINHEWIYLLTDKSLMDLVTDIRNYIVFWI